jgi:hypothetical protein
MVRGAAENKGRSLRSPATAAIAAIAVLSAVVFSACATKTPSPKLAAAADPDASLGDGGADDASDASDDGDGGEGGAAVADDEGDDPSGPCPAEMVLVTVTTPAGKRFCVDRYEASLVEVLPDGTEKPFPHYTPVDGHDVRAVSKPAVFPQGYISEVQAQDACDASGKRLCNLDEWKTACMGPSHTTFPYGSARRPGACHDTGKSAVVAVFGAKAVAASTPAAPPPVATNGKRAVSTKGRAAQTTQARATPKTTAKTPPKTAGKTPPVKGSSKTSAKKVISTKGRIGKKSTRPVSVDPGVWAKLNDPALGQVEGALSKTGEHPECVNDFGAFDMVGNLHEWVATDPNAVHGAFAGGYYLDTTINGDGCNYKTQAHAHDYHDYSTGFRCCAAADE